MNAPSLHIGDAAYDRRGRSLLDADPGPTILVVLLLAILAVRIIALAVSNAELFFDEAQYWAWGQEPAFGYYHEAAADRLDHRRDHLPVRRRAFLRSPAVAADAFPTSLVIYAIATKLHSRRVGFWAALVYALMPGTSISATLMSTDVPLLLFWAIGLLAIVHHVERPSLAAGMALGVAIGLGLNAKYAMIYLPLCYAVYAVGLAESPRDLRHPGTWAALAIALLLIAPNLIWNAGHQFATFEHTRENANWNGRFPNILGLLAFLGTQIAIAGPAPFAAFMLAAAGRPCAARSTATAALAAGHVAARLPADRRTSADLQGKRQLGGDRISSGNDAGRGSHARPRMAARHDLHAGALRAAARHLLRRLVRRRRSLGPIGRELGKMVGWGDFATKVRDLAEKNGLKTVVFVSRGLTASMIYELRDSGLEIRAYVADPRAPVDHFELTRPWSPADHGPVLLVFAGGEALPAAVAPRAKLVEQFKTEIFIAVNPAGQRRPIASTDAAFILCC